MFCQEDRLFLAPLHPLLQVWYFSSLFCLSLVVLLKYLLLRGQSWLSEALSLKWSNSCKVLRRQQPNCDIISQWVVNLSRLANKQTNKPVKVSMGKAMIQLLVKLLVMWLFLFNRTPWPLQLWLVRVSFCMFTTFWRWFEYGPKSSCHQSEIFGWGFEGGTQVYKGTVLRRKSYRYHGYFVSFLDMVVIKGKVVLPW